MPGPVIRLHLIDEAGAIVDTGTNLTLADFAGALPLPGDRIVQPPPSDLPDDAPSPERVMLDVVGRVFRPRDLAEFVALICRARPATVEEAEVLPEPEEGGGETMRFGEPGSVLPSEEFGAE